MDLSRKLKFYSKAVNIKVGLWLLPFLNVTGTVGYNVVESDIHLPKAPIGITPPGGPGQPPEIVFGERTLDLDFEGPLWATSATLSCSISAMSAGIPSPERTDKHHQDRIRQRWLDARAS